jgi:hypothetical protein
MKKRKFAKKIDQLYPALRLTPQTKDLPATQGMMQLVRSELKADFREIRSEMKSEFRQVDARFEKVLEAVHHVASEVVRIGILTEEQNSRNRVVLEGLTGLAQRQDRLEYRVDEIDKSLRSYSRTRS